MSFSFSHWFYYSITYLYYIDFNRKNGQNWDLKSVVLHTEREKEARKTANLPQTVLSVHRHVHLVHPTLRNSTSRNQETHTCEEEEETS